MAGLVYHANYLKFAERGRSEMVRAAGIDQAAMRAAGLVFAVTHMDCAFLRPARYDDALVVETEAASRTAARFVMRQTVRRGAEDLFRATVTVALLDLGGRPRRLTPEVAALFDAAA